MNNILLSGKNTITICDEKNDSNIILDQSNIYHYFPHIYLLVKKNNIPIPIEFYSMTVPVDIYNSVISNLIIYKVSVKLLTNIKHFNDIILLSSDQLKDFNIFNYELNEKNIVLPILNITYQNLLLYIEQYDSKHTLDNLYKLLTINQYFNNNTNRQQDYIFDFINNLEETKYWTFKNNCLSPNVNFKNRIFQINSKKLNKSMIEIYNKVKITKTEENYLDNKRNKFCDISNVSKLSTYKVNHFYSIDHIDINKMFDLLDNKNRFMLFSNLMISKKYCHLVINNSYILDKMKDDINNFAPLFRYLLSYSWIRFYMDECMKKTNLKSNDVIVFDINTASKLPIFPFNYEKPKSNPYMPILVSDFDLKPGYNVCGIPDFSKYQIMKNNLNSKMINSGICNFEEFKYRMNIFTTNYPNYDLFEGFDFKNNNVAISGSIITACLQRYHPLMTLFKCDNDIDNFRNYFDEYYANSDIDIIFLEKNTFKFIDKVKILYQQIINNVKKFKPDIINNDVKLNFYKVCYLFVSEDYINKFSTDEKEIIYDDNITKENIILFFGNEIDRLVKDKNIYVDDEIKEKYKEVYDFDNAIIKLCIKKSTNFRDGKQIDINISYKYKIISEYLKRQLELFPIHNDDFFSIVSSFHMPCVRGYYNGETVLMTPSCISAHMTYMNLDYKYICGSRDPLEIINKYRMRGFGTWLSDNEKKIFITYCNEVLHWKHLYSLSDDDTTNISQLFGTLNLNNKIFKPRLYNVDDSLEVQPVNLNNRYNDMIPSNILYIKNQENLSNEICVRFDCNEFDIDINKYNAINKMGYVEPVKKWLINASWEMYEETKGKKKFIDDKKRLLTIKEKLFNKMKLKK